MIGIRELCHGDLEEVRALLAELAEFTSGGARSVDAIDIEGIFNTMRRAPEVYASWVAVEAGRVIGFLSLIFYKTLFHPGGTALINELVVARDRRGQGVGRLLVRRAVEEARSRAMDEIEVGTERGNTAAQRFYKASGFAGEYVLLGMEFDTGAAAPTGSGGKG